MDRMMPLCQFCKHYQGRKFTLDGVLLQCKAYPESIPTELYFECGDHRKHYPGDNEILFEQKDNLDADDLSYLKNLTDMMDRRD